MQVNFSDLIKEQALFVALPIFIGLLIGVGAFYFGQTMFTQMNEARTQQEQISKLSSQKAELETKVSKMKKDAQDPDAKKIFTLEGMKFGAEASFAPLFEDMISIAKSSGIRIRSVDYNYAPNGDPIYEAKAPGVNICELSTTIVGTYSQIQSFLKTLLSENYLVNVAQIEIVSWQRDKSILISNLKLRYYTKTN